MRQIARLVAICQRPSDSEWVSFPSYSLPTVLLPKYWEKLLAFEIAMLMTFMLIFLFGVLNMFFVVLGLVILIVFYGTYFFKMFLQRKQGIKTNQLGKGKEGIEKTIEISMQIMTILVPVFEICSMIFQFFNLDLSMKIKYLGVFVAFFGTIIFIISVITMKNNWRAGVSESEKTELVTNGIYRISRNPAFLGFDLVYIGFLLMFFNWILFVISCSTIILFHLQITKVEEPFLVKKFGEEYEHYKNKVLRYFGRNVFMKDKIKGEI